MSTVRVNDNIKKEVMPILEDLGLSLSEAINIYLKQITITEGIPFTIKRKRLNNETIQAIEDVEKGIGLSKGYSNLEEMWNDLGKE